MYNLLLITLYEGESDILSSIKNAIDSVFTGITDLLKTVGTGLGGLLFIACSLVTLVLVIQGIWDTAFNHGQNNVWGEKGKIILIAVSLAIFGGVIVAATFR